MSGDGAAASGNPSGSPIGEAFGEVEGGRWLSYSELAEIRGIGRESAVKLVQRERWRRMPGNDRTVRVLVPTGSSRRHGGIGSGKMLPLASGKQLPGNSGKQPLNSGNWPAW
jgi:hypothetical protein